MSRHPPPFRRRLTSVARRAPLTGLLLAGWLLTSRPACAETEVVRAVDLGGLEARTAALILSGQEAGELDIFPLVIPLPGAGATGATSAAGAAATGATGATGAEVPVLLMVEIGGPSLLEGAAESDTLMIEIYAYGLDAAGGLIDSLTQVFQLDLGLHRTALSRRGVKFFGQLELPPGAYSLRVLALHRHSGRLGLRIVAAEVPVPGEAALPPVPLEAAGDWILVHQQGPEVPFPVDVDGSRQVPAVARPAARPGLEAGSGLEVEQIAAASGVATSRRKDPRGPPRRWSARKIPLATVTAAYLESFDRLAAEGRAAALRPLVELEQVEIGTGSREERRRLAEAQERAAGSFADSSPQALVPLIWLHEQLYRHYHRERRYLLATHSRQMLAELSDFYLNRRDSPQSRNLTACALISIAAYLWSSGSLPAAQSTLQLALDRQPDQPAALIGLAAIRESFGDYQGAVKLLERLERAGQAEAQVGLRLAVNLRRLGSTRRAAELLRAAVEARSPWVAALASQELAALHSADGRFGAAVEVLEAAVERHPEVQRLRLQLASVLERAGRRDQARVVLHRLDPAAGREQSSPRLRYSQMPAAALDTARRTLDEAAARHLELLPRRSGAR